MGAPGTRAIVPLILSASAMRRARMLRNRGSSRCSCSYTQISTYSINNIREGIHNNCSYSYTHETGGLINISRELERAHTRITRRREGIIRTYFVYGQANDGTADSLAFSLTLVAVAYDQTARHGTVLLGDDGWEERCRAVFTDRPAPTHTTYTTMVYGRRTVPGISLARHKRAAIPTHAAEQVPGRLLCGAH